MQQIAAAVMRPGYHFVDTSGDDGPSHATIRQESLMLPVNSLAPALFRILQARFVVFEYVGLFVHSIVGERGDERHPSASYILAAGYVGMRLLPHFEMLTI